MGIRKPKGLLNIYTVLLTNNAAIPSRFFGWFDVLTSYTLFSRCIAAYNGYEKQVAVTENRKIPKSLIDETFKIPDDHLFSPYLASEEILKEFPPTVMLTANLDFCLDENVEFARKLKKSKINFKLEVLEGLNHGFLHYANVFIKILGHDQLNNLNFVPRCQRIVKSVPINVSNICQIFWGCKMN